MKAPDRAERIILVVDECRTQEWPSNNTENSSIRGPGYNHPRRRFRHGMGDHIPAMEASGFWTARESAQSINVIGIMDANESTQSTRTKARKCNNADIHGNTTTRVWKTDDGPNCKQKQHTSQKIHFTEPRKASHTDIRLGHMWETGAYAFHPWILINKILANFHKETIQDVVLVTPNWPTQTLWGHSHEDH